MNKSSHQHKETTFSPEELLKMLEDPASLAAAEEMLKQQAEQNSESNGFELEALEGLRQMKSTEQVKTMFEQINRQTQILTQKKSRRRSKPIPNQIWFLLAVVLSLALLVLAYWVIHLSTAVSVQ